MMPDEGAPGNAWCADFGKSLGTGRSAEKQRHGLEQILHVVSEGHVLDILRVNVETIAEISVQTKIGDLVRPGHTRFYLVTWVVEIAAFAGDVDEFGPRPNQTHFAPQNIDELGKLIKAQPAKLTAKSGVTRIEIALVCLPPIVPRRNINLFTTAIRAHRTKFVNGERLASFTYALLAVEHAPAQTNPYRCGDARGKWKRENRNRTTNSDVEGAFDPALVQRARTDRSDVVRLDYHKMVASAFDDLSGLHSC